MKHSTKKYALAYVYRLKEENRAIAIDNFTRRMQNIESVRFLSELLFMSQVGLKEYSK
jgi:hypothetical protein